LSCYIYSKEGACTTIFLPLGKTFYLNEGKPKEVSLLEYSIQEGLQAVSDAEKAVIKAQSTNSPDTYQQAHNELMNALQLMNELMKGDYAADQKEELKLANVHLKNLFDTNDAIQY
jgi:hypothetical protein